MKILFIGDIVGHPGRNAVKILLPKLRGQHGLDVIIANGENSAGGNGITPDIAAELFGYGVDAITTGDHLWDQKEVMELLQNEKRFLRPLNYPPGTPGKGSAIFFHIRRGVNRATAGCTTMAESDLVGVITWLRAGRDPCFALLTNDVYREKWREWKLPAPELAGLP